MTTSDADLQPELSADGIRAAYWRKQPVSVEQVGAFLSSIDEGLEVRARPSLAASIYFAVALVLVLVLPPIFLFVFASGLEFWLPRVIGPLYVLVVANSAIASMLLILSVAPGSAQRHEDAHIAKQLAAALEPPDQDLLLANFREGQYPRLAKFCDHREGIFGAPTFHTEFAASIDASRQVNRSGDSTNSVEASRVEQTGR